MTRIEDRLTAALSAAAGTVREDGLRPLTAPAQPPREPRRWPRIAAPIAAAAAAAAIIGVAVGIGRMGPAPQPVNRATAAAPAVPVGGFPTGIAVDAGTGTVYVASGVANSLTLISAATCNAGDTSGCRPAGHAVTGGQDPIGVAVDEQTRTVYVVNGGSGTLAVISAATCNAGDTSGCGKPAALVPVPGGPEFLAVDQQTGTVYVADTSSGQVSVIDGRTCNAAVTSGCSKPVASVSAGAGAFPITVDPATSTVYAGTSRGVTVIDGRTCNGTDTSGCRAPLATVPVPGYPAGITVDQGTGTVYVSSESGTVTVLNRSTCSSRSTTGCAGRAPAVTVGSDARGDVADPATRTVYVTNAGSDTVSMISTSACSAGHPAGCGQSPASFPVGASPRRIAVDPAAHTVYVVNVLAGTLSVIDEKTCNAQDSHGCPAQPPAGTAAGPGRPAAGGAMTSSCAPAAQPASSGQPAGPLTATSVRVASGTVGGQPWSLWARKGMARQAGIENGGLVLDGRWYGMCPGFPNVAEMELVDAGPHGVAYGFVQYPSRVTVGLAAVAADQGVAGGSKLPAPSVTRVGGLSFFIGQLPRPACSYPAMVLTAAAGRVFSALHHLQFGTCAAGRLVTITESNGVWGPGGAAVAAGPGGAVAMAGGGGPLVNQQDECNFQATASGSGRAAGPLISSSVQVAAGSAGGQRWALWARKGLSGVRAIENGGVVIGGRWYGLCPGAPNPAEFELLDAGPHGIVYGYVANPGRYVITFSPAGQLTATQIRRLNGGTFFIGQLVKPACAYRSLVLTAKTAGVTDMHQFSFGGCRPGQLVTTTGGQGSW